MCTDRIIQLLSRGYIHKSSQLILNNFELFIFVNVPVLLNMAANQQYYQKRRAVSIVNLKTMYQFNKTLDYLYSFFPFTGQFVNYMKMALTFNSSIIVQIYLPLLGKNKI